MKMRPEQLTSTLQKGLATVYALSGNEPVLLEDAVTLIKRVAEQQQLTEIHSLTVDHHFDWDAWLIATQTPSLFSPGQLFILQIPTGKPGDKGSTALQQYCKQAPAECCLIVILPKLDSSTLKTKWWLALEQTGIVMQFWPLDKTGQKQWLLQQLSQYSWQLTPPAIDILVEQTLGNLLALRQYLTQFNLIFPPARQISVEDLQEYVLDQGQFDIFSLVDICNLGDAIRCVRILKKLQANGTEAILILWALTLELRQLQTMQKKLLNGTSFDSLSREFRIPLTRQLALQSALKRLTLPTLLLLLQQATGIDTAIKGGNALPLWPTLERWALAYCGVTC